jgi:O-antigen/teichoic acid export membrane protein
VVWNVIWAMERTDVELFITMVGALVAVIADVGLIPHYGVFGAAVSRVVAQTLVSALAVAFLVWRLGVAPPFADLGRILACALLCALVARVCLLLAPGPLGLPLAVAMGAAVYLLSARWLKALPEEDIARFRSLAASLPGAIASPAHRILDMMATRRT